MADFDNNMEDNQGAIIDASDGWEENDGTKKCYKEWIGQFTSRDNFIYKVVIKKEYVIDEVTTIKLSVPPFVVKYEGNSDLNKPLKLSNATINILTNEIPWELVTQKSGEIKVSLIREAKGTTPRKIMWMGYVEPSVYTMGANVNLEQFELNCVDCLSTLEQKPYGKGHEESILTPSTKSFLDIILQAIKDFPYTSIYFPQMFRCLGADTSLSNFTISEKAFIDDDCFYRDESGNIKYSYDKNDTYKTIIEIICKFLNVTMVADGNSLYLLPMDYLDTDYEYKVYSISNGKVTSTDTDTIKVSKVINKLYQPTSYSLTEQYNQVKVTSKMQDYDSIIPDFFDDKFLSNTTYGTSPSPISGWNAQINQTISDNQKGGKRIKDACRWRFYDHTYWKSHYYDGFEEDTERTSTNTTTMLEDTNCAQILKYGYSAIVDKDSKYYDHNKEANLTNYVLMTTYNNLPTNTQPPVLMESQNMPKVFVFQNSYLLFKYEVLFRPNNGSPWHLPSSWIEYDKDEYKAINSYLEFQLSCKVGDTTYYYNNSTGTAIPIDESGDSWANTGYWAVGYPTYKLRIPFQCSDNRKHLYGKNYKNVINSGISGNEGCEDGWIVKPPEGAVGKFAEFNLKIYYRRMPTNDSDHTTAATWMKSLSMELKIPKDESIKNWKADTEYTAVISDEYVKNGESIDFEINTFDSRVPSWSCVVMNFDNGTYLQPADKISIVGSSEQSHRMEEWKIYHKVKQHQVPRKVLTTTIEGGVIPSTVFTHQGTKYFANEWEVDYYDNKTNIELIEVWNSLTD